MAIDPSKLTLYLITDPHLCARFGVEQTVDAAVKGGATMVQLRDKHASTEERVALASRLKPICTSHGAVLVINDDVEAAHISDVDGVHIGQGDMDVALARQTIGPDKIVGLSVETVTAARQVSDGLVDYVGISPVYATPTKQDHKPPIGFDGLAEICAASPVYSVAVGGLKLADCHDVLATGVHGMAVVSAICGQDDPYAASLALAQSLASYERQR
ncbi:MAG: thiamine phosphate synthase [Candidatus Puniceispirillaceae bacterium]|jgi:thiamine-phosphate pyrophosphorylase